MGQPERQKAIRDVLERLDGIEPLKQLFWRELNYDRINRPLSRRDWTTAAASALSEDPLLLAEGGDAFHVIYSRLAENRLLIGKERPVVATLLRDHPYSLFVFSDNAQKNWHFVNVKIAERVDEAAQRDPQKRPLFRRITVGPDERLRTACERLEMLDLAEVGHEPLAIQKRHDDAFDVEKVTNLFFRNYCDTAFKPLRAHLKQTTDDETWSHEYALQFLNRVMFLYFVQRKRWLGSDREFLNAMWKAYGQNRRPRDTFVGDWLNVLFFGAFNKKFEPSKHRYMGEPICAALADAPFLNGGLFKPNTLDNAHRVAIPDDLFGRIFNFFESYNFTIAEDTPLDQEMAVDPEMIGKVYESLVNVSDDIDKRGEAGIFYTPRTEIDLMCKLSLVEYLHERAVEEIGGKRDRDGQDEGDKAAAKGKKGQKPKTGSTLKETKGAGYDKKLLYEFVFARSEEEKNEADMRLGHVPGLWPEVLKALGKVTVADPACGSGSFLVGMLNILADLIQRAHTQNGDALTSAYDVKKEVIGRSLYGVDVMPWAVAVAELRLWLQLVADRETKPADDGKPLLPDLTFRIRCGDSLVEEIGGHIISIRSEAANPSPRQKAIIADIAQQKLSHYRAASDAADIAGGVRRRRIELCDMIFEDTARPLRERIAAIDQALNRRQGGLGFGEHDGMDAQRRKVLAAEREALQSRLDELQEAARGSRNKDFEKFFWELDFPEVFSEWGGFDIVIGNPPYVRQENIADRTVSRDRVTTDAKKAYKEKLRRSVRAHLGGRLPPKLDMKSDLYVYFYLHGLSLLNPRGTFCFITSNSWLDVGYGKDLQQFLLENCHVKLIIDNKLKRSFASADVNTIIALFSAPKSGRGAALKDTARFVMFKVPFEQVIHPVIFEEIEEAGERKATPDYRVVAKKQEALLEEGLEPLDDDADAELAQSRRTYRGNKWGGKYLRAPDIYWTILQKGQGRLVELGDIAEVRRGFTTGANEFFYLDDPKISEWGIEKRFCRALLKGPKDVRLYGMSVADLTSFVFCCDEPKSSLRGTRALDYIQWGEAQTVRVRRGTKTGEAVRGYNRLSTLANRTPWYALSPPLETRVFLNKGINDRHFALVMDKPIACDQQIYQVKALINEREPELGILLNSTITALFAELIGRRNFGEGVLWLATYEVAQFPVVDPRKLEGAERKGLQEAFRSICRREPLSIVDEVVQADRQLLDEIVGSLLGLTKSERDAVYEAVINLVEARLKKAESV